MTSAHTTKKFVVLRDDRGLPIRKIEALKNQRQTWRSVLRAMTNDGADLLAKMYDIAMGKPFVVELTNGLQTEPEVPTLETQRMAAMDLMTLLHGRAVPQTEVAKAEESALEAIRAMSDEDLARASRAILEAGEEAQVESSPLESPEPLPEYEVVSDDD